MAEIYAITVSTRYADLLRIIIHQNVKFFKKWYIVTHPSDDTTIKVIRDASYNNIELLFYDFYNNGSSFDFGGARLYCQKHILSQFGVGKIVLMLDSDIYLPDNFLDSINSITINKNTLYGISKRYDYGRMTDFIARTTNNPYRAANEFHGFFQMFIQEEHNLYKNSYDCSRCDLDFHKCFNNKIIIPLTLYHLGKSGVHWRGRLTTADFINDI
ncbi:MAG: glycosyltransferase family 2 protein [Actinobacteria bacterium]|nr:glycosyltransferase family 2 protein [Actinomycetota bacterium]